MLALRQRQVNEDLSQQYCAGVKFKEPDFWILRDKNQFDEKHIQVEKEIVVDRASGGNSGTRRCDCMVICLCTNDSEAGRARSDPSSVE
jgi:hypothetical protein